jgi:Big-like domain-containing protein/PKD domain-containing protein
MVTHMRPPTSLAVALGAITFLSLALACDKVPLLAPTGSVISLFATANTVPLNSEIEIVANVIENGVTSGGTTTPGTPGTSPSSTTTPGAGTPVQNGTVVSFTTTIGRIEPSEARTSNGTVRVRFISGGQSGIATITAFSGGASGKLENLKVGSAGVERVLISASPQTLGPSGGTSTITARVEDTSGSGLAGIPVTFSTDAGSLSSSSVTTDSAGNASTTLTTSRQSKVTANVIGKTAEVTIALNPRTGITLAGPTTPVSAGVPTTFTVGVGTAANVRDVTIDFGDGDRRSLGAISGSTTIQHTYNEAGTFSVSATAVEASGFTETVSTAVTILPGQPPAVIITASNNNPSVGETVIFTATVSGATSTVLRYEWNFGNGAVPATAETTGNRATASYLNTGTKIITVRVVQATGPSGDGQTAIVVKP